MAGVAPAPTAGSRIARNVAAMAGAQLVTWSASLIWTLVVPRALGPSGMGIIVTAWSITGVLGVLLGLGTRNYLVREIVVQDGQGAQLLGTALVLRTVLMPLFVTAAVSYAVITGMHGDAVVVLYLAIAATVFTQLAEPLQAAFQAVESTTGRNMKVWKSFIGTPYQPTTSGFVSSDSMSASIQR